MKNKNWKTIKNVVIFGLLIFFIFKKINKKSELGEIKKINKIFYSGDFETAKENLELHLKKYPKSSFAWSYLGTINIELNDTINAEKAYNKGYSLNKKNEKALIGLGIVERMKGNYSKAKEYYEKAIKVKPENPDVYSSLLILEIIDGNYEKAVKLGEKAKNIKLKNKRLGNLGNLAIAYHYNKQYEKRDEILKKLKELNYKDLIYINMIISGNLDIKDYL